MLHVEHHGLTPISEGAIPAASTNHPLIPKGFFLSPKAACDWIGPDWSRLRQSEGSPVAWRKGAPRV